MPLPACNLSAAGFGLTLSELIITVFLFLTAPVSAHMLSRAVLPLPAPRRADPPEWILREAPPANDEEP